MKSFKLRLSRPLTSDGYVNSGGGVFEGPRSRSQMYVCVCLCVHFCLRPHSFKGWFDGLEFRFGFRLG